MKKGRPKRISVLFIPDDDAEPRSFRLSLKLVRLLYILGFVLLVHILAGGFAYWKWFKVQKENRILTAKNNDLREDNKRIFLLQQRFEALSNNYQKVLDLLGIDGVRSSSIAVNDRQIAGGQALDSREFAEANRDEVRPDLARISSKSRIISRKETTLHDYTPFLPTLLPVEGYLSAEFSTRTWMLGDGSSRVDDWHPGIDIAARRGTDILAAGAGLVVFAGWTSRYGNMVIINHGDNIFSYYAHNSKLLVRDKAFVRKGEPIAQLGNSGYTSKGPHLHFEIWKDGKPVNPREYILAFHDDGS